MGFYCVFYMMPGIKWGFHYIFFIFYNIHTSCMVKISVCSLPFHYKQENIVILLWLICVNILFKNCRKLCVCANFLWVYEWQIFSLLYHFPFWGDTWFMVLSSKRIQYTYNGIQYKNQSSHHCIVNYKFFTSMFY